MSAPVEWPGSAPTACGASHRTSERPARASPPKESFVSKPVVLIAEELSPATIDALGPDFDVRNVDGTDRPALLAALADANAVLDPLGDEDRRRGDRGRAACSRSSRARASGSTTSTSSRRPTAGVMVVNAPTSNIISAAELTVGHILSLARHIPAAHASLAQGQWKRSRRTPAPSCSRRPSASSASAASARSSPRACRRSACDVVAYDPYVTSARAQQLGVQLREPRRAARAERLRHDPHAEDARDHRHDRRRAVRDA